MSLKKSISALGGSWRLRSSITLSCERIVPVGQLEAPFPRPARAADQLVVVGQLIRMDPHQRKRRGAQHQRRPGPGG